MRESKFILQNQEKWQKYEDGIRRNNLAADEMEHAFVELNDDLAYARTFYKNRAVRLFLNNLLAPVYTRIYNVRKWNRKALFKFFTQDAPLMNFQARKYILISLIVVLMGVGIGFFGTRADGDFASTVLGHSYVRITEENIRNGDPLAIYKYESPGDMFVHIALNNLTVAFYFFLFGALFCVGTMYFLLANGIMLGAFTYIFTSRGLGTEYALTVYQHGTLEIMSMVIEGAAGIMMGAGFLFPGTKTRLRSIQDNAKKSILMFLVCIPIIILAAFIESYLTRFTKIPNALRVIVIALSFIFMLGYFVVLPWFKFRKNETILGKYDKLEKDNNVQVEAGRVYNTGRITLFAFDYLKKRAFAILMVGVFGFVLMLPVVNKISNNAIRDDIHFQYRQYKTGGDDGLSPAESNNVVFRLLYFDIYSTCYLFSAKVNSAISASAFLLLFILLFVLFYGLKNFLAAYSGNSPPLMRIIIACGFCAGFQVTLNLFFGSGWWFSMILFLPVQILVAFVYLTDGSKNVSQALTAGLAYLFAGFWRFIANGAIAVLLYFILMIGIMYIVGNVVQLTAQMHGGSILSENVLFFYAALNYFLMPFILSIAFYIYFLSAASIVESRTGKALKSHIAEFRLRKEVYGIETE